MVEKAKLQSRCGVATLPIGKRGSAMHRQSCWFLAAAVLCLASTGLVAQATQATAGPLTKQEVYDLVVGGVDNDGIIKAVYQRGIDFKPTDDYLKNLESHGANRSLLDTLRADAPSSPLTKEQVYDLVVGGVDNGRIVKAVEERGIDFQPTDDYLESLESHGANGLLVDTLRASRPSPISKSELIRFLTAGTDIQVLTAMVGRRGIDFHPTPEDLDTLGIAGAQGSLIEAVQHAKYHPDTTPSAAATPPPPVPTLAPPGAPSVVPLVSPSSKAPHSGTPTDGVYSVGGDVTEPVAIYDPDPPYSKEADKQKFQGKCVLQAIIDPHGNVRDVQVLKHVPYGLDQTAVRTVNTWRFKPATRNGVPVPVRIVIEVTFHLF
jgi:TonB family protein